MEGLFDGMVRGRSNFTVVGPYTGGNIAEESILSLVTVLGSSISLVGLVFAFITYR
ncbi:UNVERIFIED_CONTAM: hypothetical protein PYX00_007850 [Menopon gallinae]|uniref:Uncharacterized protein n=1 Tax=Menopon gallinae TaxID=328185 RepID=A0AAW2HKK2_9NEOP